MELKTKIKAEEGKQDLTISREFDLPLESKKHGSYQFETTDPRGNKHRFNGAIHEFSPNQKITRTFEMENTPFGVQLEFLEFEKLTDDTSKLNMHVVYRSVVLRDQILKLPFAQGINMAHNRLQDVLNNLKNNL